MNCQEINHQLGALLDQALEPAQATAVERHLRYCAECQAELEHLRALKTALQSVEPPLASASLDERVIAAFRLRHGRAHAVSKVSGWRAWLFNSFTIPKPALALMAALLIGASALAYRAGEVMGTRLPVIEPPAQARNQTALPQPVESVRFINVKTPGDCARPNSPPQAESAKAPDARLAALQLETQTSASEAGIDYTTSAALESFEPVKDPSVRIIKGGNQ